MQIIQSEMSKKKVHCRRCRRRRRRCRRREPVIIFLVFRPIMVSQPFSFSPRGFAR